MRRAFLIACLSAAVTFAAEDQADFKPLFNGRDLDGWVNVNCAPDTWSVKDGVIHCTGTPTGVLSREVRPLIVN